MATWTNAAPDPEHTGWAPRRNPGLWVVLARRATCHAPGCSRRIEPGEVAAIYEVADGETALACRQCAGARDEGEEAT